MGHFVFHREACMSKTYYMPGTDMDYIHTFVRLPEGKSDKYISGR
jgi:hypothetical protein